MNFSEMLKKEDNKTTTQNNAPALRSTESSLVDLFATSGAMREFTPNQITSMFQHALNEDKLLATKIMFHTRNIRGGLGERRVFRIMLNYLGNNYPDIIYRNLELISEYGRWDDMFSLIDTPCEEEMFIVLQHQLETDLACMKEGVSTSLLAKWLKTQNTSSTQSKYIYKKTLKAFGMSRKEYQKKTSALRRYIDVTEVKMCSKEWDKIHYPSVPSNCMMKNKSAFYRNDGNRFEKYIEEVASGEAKINSSTLYPFDIFRDIEVRTTWGYYCESGNWNEVAEQQWKSLPNYLEDRDYNVLVMADTSGSMEGDPLLVSLSLAVYFAERSTGIYKNKFMTFSSEPRFIEIKGDNLKEKISNIPSIVENTNLEKAFRLILDTAINNNVHQDDLPKSLVIISDMQFDSSQCHQSERYNNTLHDQLEKQFQDAGYQMPNIVYWNVNSNKRAFQVSKDVKNTQLVSGISPTVFKQLLDNLGKTPYVCMLNTLNNPIYDCIKI